MPQWRWFSLSKFLSLIHLWFTFYVLVKQSGRTKMCHMHISTIFLLYLMNHKNLTSFAFIGIQPFKLKQEQEIVLLCSSKKRMEHSFLNSKWRVQQRWSCNSNIIASSISYELSPILISILCVLSRLSIPTIFAICQENWLIYAKAIPSFFLAWSK